MKKPFLLALLWCGIIIAALFFSLSPHTAPPESYHIDKLMHFFAYVSITLFSFFVFSSKRGHIIVSFILITMAVGTEILQHFIANRTGSWEDGVTNVVAILISILVYVYGRRSSGKP